MTTRQLKRLFWIVIALAANLTWITLAIADVGCRHSTLWRIAIGVLGAVGAVANVQQIWKASR